MENGTRKSVKNCAKWLAYCLEIGWQKSDLEDLEKIWWKFRDKNGKLLKQLETPNH